MEGVIYLLVNALDAMHRSCNKKDGSGFHLTSLLMGVGGFEEYVLEVDDSK